MVLAASQPPGHAKNTHHSNSLDLLPPPNPLEHWKKILKGFCDPHNSVSQDEDDDNNEGAGSPHAPPSSSSSTNQVQITTSVETKVIMDRSLPEPTSEKLINTSAPIHVVVVEQHQMADEQVEMEIVVSSTTVTSVVVNPSSGENAATNDAEELMERDGEKEQHSSGALQTIPLRAHRLPYIVKSTFYTLTLLVFTWLALGRMGYHLDIEFSPKVLGEKGMSLIITDVSHQGGQQQVTASSRIPPIVETFNEKTDRQGGETDPADSENPPKDQPSTCFVNESALSEDGPSLEGKECEL